MDAGVVWLPLGPWTRWSTKREFWPYPTFAGAAKVIVRSIEPSKRAQANAHRVKQKNCHIGTAKQYFLRFILGNPKKKEDK